VISIENQQFFPPPCIFRPTEGVPLGIGYWRMGSKNYGDGATGPNKKFDDIFSNVDTMHHHDRRLTSSATDASQLRVHGYGTHCQSI